MQRCSSYVRLVSGRAVAAGLQRRSRRQQNVGAASSVASSPRDEPEADDSSPEGAIKAHSQLLESSLELGGVYSALEYAKLHGGVAKAICIDELVDEGAQGAGLDILSPMSLDAQAPAASDDEEAVDVLIDTAEVCSARSNAVLHSRECFPLRAG